MRRRQRGQRAQELSRAMLELARSAGLRTAVYPRFTVQARFADNAATTRYEIALVVAKEIEALRPDCRKNENPGWRKRTRSHSLMQLRSR